MTAVEWLIKDLISKGILTLSLDIETGIKLVRAYEQAKEMEKEQSIDFAVSCLQSNGCFFDIEEHYNKTFKSEQTEDALKLVLNDIKNTPEDVFNKQWESIKKKLKKPLKDSNPITKYLKSE